MKHSRENEKYQSINRTEMVINNSARGVLCDYTDVDANCPLREDQYLASKSKAELSSDLVHLVSPILKLESGPVIRDLVGADCQAVASSHSFKNNISAADTQTTEVKRISPPWSPQDIRLRDSPVSRPNMDRTYIKPKNIYRAYHEDVDECPYNVYD